VTSRAAALPGAGRADAGRGGAGRSERALWIAVAIGVAIVLAAAVLRVQANPILAAVVLPLALVAYQRAMLAWETLFGLILLVILFIPIRRYTVGGGLPVELEPYRLLLGVVLIGWLFAICADPAVRWRNTGLEAPILLVIAAILGSLALNVPRVNAVSSLVLKQVTFFLTFFLIVYFVASVMERGPKLERMVRLLVAGGTILAVLSLIEWRTGTNFFNGLQHVIPFLHYVDFGDHIARGTGFRALGSAQHPIALGAALVMLIPLTVYLYRRDDHWVWLVCATVLTLGAFASGSRTAAIMLVVLLVTFLWIKRQETMRLVPMLIPLAVVIQIVMPGTLGTFRAILQPSYLVREQSQEVGAGSGRIADLGPSLSEASRTPLLGQGFGTRVVSTDLGPGDIGSGGTVVASKVQILDDQWLTTLLEIGVVGILGLLWLFCRAVRRLAQRARSDTGPESWLATALAAALAAYAVGMLTFDAFAFIQVTFLAFIMLGFTAVVTRDAGT
jgi:polysaccharide biosynthesis protein PslJ